MVGEDMSAHKTSNLSGSSPGPLNNNDFKLHRAKRRSAWESFFDESDSEDEEEMLLTAYHIADSLVKLPESQISGKCRCNNKECYVITNLQKVQVLNVCCAHCACCKKMKEFLERLPTNKSAASYDNGIGRSSRHRKKRFKKTLSTPKSSWKVDTLDKHSDLSSPNYMKNRTNRSTAKIVDNEDSLSDFSFDGSTFEPNCTVRNTELSKTNDENSNTINIVPNVQNDALSSKKLEIEKTGAEKKIETRRSGFVRRNGTGHYQNVNNIVASWKDHSNDVSDKTGNNTNVSNSDFSFDECTSEQNYTAITNTELKKTNGENLNTINVLPKVQNMYVNNTVHCSKDHSNDVPENTGNNTNSINSDFSFDECTSEPNCTVRNTELNKTNDENSNTMNIVPNVQNDALSSKKLEIERKWTEQKIATRRNGLVCRNGTEPNQNVKNTVRSSKDHSNDVPENTEDKTNLSNSDSLDDEYTSKKDCTVRNSMSDIRDTNDQNRSSTSTLPGIQNDELGNYKNGGIKKIVNRSKKIKVQKPKVGPPKKVKTVNNAQPPQSDANDSPEKTTDSNDAPEKTESNTIHSYAKHTFNLKHEKRATRSNTPLVAPLLKVSVDTTTNRNFSKAVVRKLGRTGGISFDMEPRNTATGSCKSFYTQKSRTLYSSDEWLNSEGFLKLSGDEY